MSMATRVERIRAARTTVSNLRTLAGWYWRDVLWRSRSTLAVIAALDGGALTCQIAALGVVFGYSRALERGTAVTALGQSLVARESPVLLVAAAVAGFALLALSGILRYRSSCRGLALMRQYQVSSQKRALILMSRLPHPKTPRANAMLASGELDAGARQEAWFCALALRFLINAMLPAARAVTFACVLLYISVPFAAITFALVAVSSLALLVIGRGAAYHSLGRERSAAAAGRELRSHVQRIMTTPAPLADPDEDLERTYQTGPVPLNLDANYGRFFARQETALMTTLLTAVAMLAVVLVAGFGVLSQAWPWSVVLAYVVALRSFLGSVGSLQGTVTDLGRTYPQALRYSRLVGEAEPVAHTHPRAIPAPPVTIEVPSFDGHSNSLEARPGRATLLVTWSNLNRVLAAHLLRRVSAHADQPGISCWFAGAQLLPGLSLRDHVGLPEAMSRRELVEFLAQHLSLPADRAEEDLPNSLDERLTVDQLAALPATLWSAVAAAAGLLSNRSLLLLRDEHMDAIDPNWALDLPIALADRLVFVVVPPDRVLERSPADTVFVAATESGLVGWGTVGWLAEHPGTLEDVCGATKAAALARAASMSLTEEEDDV